jgi:hypothetical protein
LPYHYSLFLYFWVGARELYLYPYLGPSLPFWDTMLSTTMSYGDLARGLHLQNPLIDFSNLNLAHDNYLFDSDYFSYLVDSPENIPSPEMRDIDYFPHRVYIIGGNCTGCILSAADCHPSCCGTASDSCCGTRPRSTVSVRRHNTHPRSKHPYTRRHATSKLQRTRSLTDINNSNIPSPLRHSAVAAAGAGQVRSYLHLFNLSFNTISAAVRVFRVRTFAGHIQLSNPAHSDSLDHKTPCVAFYSYHSVGRSFNSQLGHSDDHPPFSYSCYARQRHQSHLAGARTGIFWPTDEPRPICYWGGYKRCRGQII